jgi:glyoxylase-like metal-dependent hydrolase (beta-lactamase superfamily II)
MYFRTLYAEASGDLTYLLADLHARQAVFVDPHSPDLSVLAALLAEKDLQLRWVLRTHHHDRDPAEEVAQLASLGAPVVQDGGTFRGAPGSALYRPRDGETLPFGGEVVQVVATPGHTEGCLSYIWRDRVFCGGLLAVEECVHQPFAAAPHRLWDSVTQRIFNLPGETLLFSGHARQARSVSTVLDQRRPDGHPNSPGYGHFKLPHLN